MRAVSFFGPGEGPGIGVSAGMAAAAAAVDAVGELGGTGNRVVGGLAAEGAAAVGMEAEEGGDVGGRNGNGFVGEDGDADGVCAAGGATGASGIFGGRGAERSGAALVVRALTPFGGGLMGKLMRTVSRAEVAPVDGDGRGGRVIRTVSFFGSCGSAMRKVARRNLPSRVCQAAPYMPSKIFGF